MNELITPLYYRQNIDKIYMLCYNIQQLSG
jgi:hypothetical protein